MWSVLATIALTTLALGEGARILAVLPVHVKSHHHFSQALLKALARAGHEVVVYSPFPLDHPEPNYTDVFMDNVSTENDNITQKVLKLIEFPHVKCLDLFIEVSDMEFEPFINSRHVQQLIKSNQHFDLVVTAAFAAQEFTVILGDIFRAPIIALQSFPTNSVANKYFGNDLSISFIPDTCSPFSDNLSFSERLLNLFYVVRNYYYVYYNLYLPSLENKMKIHFPDATPLTEMIQNISLIFINDHMTSDYPRPRTPNIIPVGGIHVQDEKALPKNIQKFMDDAADGVVLFSLGSNVPDERQPKEYFNMYIRVFGQLKQRVLWKTRKEDIQGLPDNVMTLKWAPQRDILAHPKMVLFITHGGLLSQLETIHCGVPVVVIPQFFDQHRNARLYEEKGVGVRLNSRQLSEITVLNAIRTVLDKPQYADNMRRLSRVFRDRPMSPADTVVFWTEHVLRHGGSHLRPASTQLAWYQLALLDVLAFLLTLAVAVCLLIYYMCSRILHYILYLKDMMASKPLKKKRT